MIMYAACVTYFISPVDEESIGRYIDGREKGIEIPFVIVRLAWNPQELQIDCYVVTMSVVPISRGRARIFMRAGRGRKDMKKFEGGIIL